jgi:hypothetical protein
VTVIVRSSSSLDPLRVYVGGDMSIGNLVGKHAGTHIRAHQTEHSIVGGAQDVDIFDPRSSHQTSLLSLDHISRHDIKRHIAELNIEAAVDRQDYHERRIPHELEQKDLLADRAFLVATQAAHIARGREGLRKAKAPLGAPSAIARAIKEDRYAEHFGRRVGSLNADLQGVAEPLAHLNWLLSITPRYIGLMRNESGGEKIVAHFGSAHKDARRHDMARTFPMTFSLTHNVPVEGLHAEAEAQELMLTRQPRNVQPLTIIPTILKLSVPKRFDDACGVGVKFLKGLQAENRSVLTTDMKNGDEVIHLIGEGVMPTHQRPQTPFRTDSPVNIPRGGEMNALKKLGENLPVFASQRIQVV